jgi:hypothetical protein
LQRGRSRRRCQLSGISAPNLLLKIPRSFGRFTEIGQQIFPHEQQNPAALAALQKAEIEIWRPIVKAAGIKAE